MPLHGAAQRLIMMGHKTISAPQSEFEPRFEAGSRRRLLRASPRGRFLLTAAVLSVGIHLAAALLVVLLPKVLPTEARPQEQGTVELLMVEQKGDQAHQARRSSESNPSPPQDAKIAEAQASEAKPAKARLPKAQTPGPVAAASPALPAAEPGNEPAPLAAAATEPPQNDQSRTEQRTAEAAPPPPTHPDQIQAKQPSAKPADIHTERPMKQAEAQPAPTRPQEAPVFNLEGTDSESNAVVMGGNVLPAMRDDRFRNRPPIYPVEAEIHNQHGSVVVMIHVSASGAASGVDVLESSGVEVLDQAAVDAVRKWHFHPAMQGGQPIPFDMPFRFVFQPY